MRKLFISIATLLCCVSVCVAHALQLEIQMLDGTKETYLLDKSFKITFEEGNLLAKSDNVSACIPLSKIDSYRIDASSGVISVSGTDNATISFENGIIIIRNCDKPTNLQVCDINGRIVVNESVQPCSEQRISLNGLQHGVYIVSVNNTSIKVML